MKLETKTLRIEFDSVFTSLQRNFETGSAWVPRGAREGQPPILNFGLSAVRDIEDEFSSAASADVSAEDAYREMLLAYFATKREGIRDAENSTITLAGFSAHVQVARSTQTTRNGAKEEIFHLFVNVLFGDGYCQEFSCDCKLTERERFEPLFWEALRSASFHGDRAAAYQEQDEFFDRALARIEAIADSAGDSSDGDTDAPGVGALPDVPAGPRFTVASGEAEFVAALKNDDSHVGVASMTGEFGFKLVARMEQASDAKRIELITGRDSGEVSLKLHLKGVYGEGGVPTGSFRFTEDRCEAPRASMSLDGFDYSLHFTGDVHLRDGWIQIRGALGCSYNDAEDFAVTIDFPFDSKGIDWANYQFTTLKELDAAPVEAVQNIHLSVSGDEAAGLEPGEFKELRSLVLMGQGQEAPRLTLPFDLGGLRHLERLYVRNFRLDAVPESIGQLERLNSVVLIQCSLDEVPRSIWTLPELVTLILDHNRLTELPERIDLPKLVSLSVENNALVTVPEAFAIAGPGDGPGDGAEKAVSRHALGRLSLSGNPLEALPDAFNHTDVKIGLSSEDKRRLLDYEYKGADGAGLVKWDDEGYFARSSPELAAEMDKALAAPELAPRANALRFLIKRAVAFEQEGPEDYATTGHHRFGGMPDLPPSIPYPRFSGKDYEDNPFDFAYEFLAQINLEDIAPLQSFLPRTGILYFFLTTVHDVYGGSETAPIKVIHHDGPLDDLIPGSKLKIRADEYSEMSDDAYAGFRATASVKPSPPEFYGSRSNPHLFRGDASQLASDEDFMDDYGWEFVREAFPSGESADHAINAYGFSQNEDPEHQAALARRGNPEDWTILLKIGSRGDFLWGDAGDLFIVAHKSDLARGDFSGVFCTLESS